jgi:hypothetical protein
LRPSRSCFVAGVERVVFSPLVGFDVKSLDVGIELFPIDAPDPTPADLDGRELTGSNERIDLRDADVQVRRYVLERQEPGLDPGSRRGRIGAAHVGVNIAPIRSWMRDFDPVCARLFPLASSDSARGWN